MILKLKTTFQKIKTLIPLLTILLLGLAIRTFNLNWDQGSFLHPDERFLVMVSQSLKTPQPKLNYFNPNISSFNPVNTGHNFYVYGSLPVVIHKLMGEWLPLEVGFLEATLLGRLMSAIIDTFVIVLIYKIAELLEKPLKLKTKTKLWASLIYALMVFPIQIAHFFTVDPFMNFFSLLGVYFSLKFFMNTKKSILVAWSGMAFALALAAKVNAVYPMALAVALITHGIWRNNKTKFIGKLFRHLLFFSLTTYFGLRLFNPGYFASSNIFNPNLSPVFLKNIEILNTWSNPETWFPPSIQWLGKPRWFAVKNLVLYGLGLPVTILTLAGLYEFIKRKSDLWIILAWIFGFIFWQSIQFAKTMRYLLIIYPWLAIMGALGVEHIQNRLSKKKPFKNRFLINICLIIFIAIWPLSFINIYTQNHSRVQASIWLEKNLSTNTVLLSEYWDDALPVARNFKKNKAFVNKELHVFDQDTPEKWNQLDQQLSKGEYYILSSNRAWLSIIEHPLRYPKMSAFYAKLLADNNTNFKLEKEFQVKPSLNWLGIPLTFDDSFAEEAFTVYDHPTVKIFKNTN